MKKLSLIVLVFIWLPTHLAAESANSPRTPKVAVSLSYDDALNSQLDNAIPALNQYNFKASFYLSLTSPVVRERLAEWRQAARDGHELGNHTIYHPCSKSQPGTDWVAPYNDMDKRTIEQMRDEIQVANAFLYAIDGRDERTFTPPCGHLETANGNYLPAVRDLFVAIKGAETKLPENFSHILLPSNQTGTELIDAVKEASRNHQLIQIIFHGIGGDYLSVSDAAHRQLLEYLDSNRETYRVDTYLNIMSELNP